VGQEPAEEKAHELGVAAAPAVLDVEVDDRPVDPREPQPDQGGVGLGGHPKPATEGHLKTGHHE
jgi:hypothetical protein